jgi:hypothetical protein
MTRPEGKYFHPRDDLILSLTGMDNVFMSGSETQWFIQFDIGNMPEHPATIYFNIDDARKFGGIVRQSLETENEMQFKPDNLIILNPAYRLIDSMLMRSKDEKWKLRLLYKNKAIAGISLA